MEVYGDNKISVYITNYTVRCQRVAPHERTNAFGMSVGAMALFSLVSKEGEFGAIRWSEFSNID